MTWQRKVDKRLKAAEHSLHLRILHWSELACVCYK